MSSPGSPGGTVGKVWPDSAGSGESDASGPSAPNGPSLWAGCDSSLLGSAAGSPVVSREVPSVVRVVPPDEQPTTTSATPSSAATAGNVRRVGPLVRPLIRPARC